MDELPASREGSELERAAVRNAMDLMIIAAEQGIQPSAEQKRRLLALWGAQQSLAKVTTVSDQTNERVVQTIIREPEKLSSKDINDATYALIQDCLMRSDFIIQGRQVFGMMENMTNPRHAEVFKRIQSEALTDREKKSLCMVGNVILASLEASLDSHAALDVLAKKITMLHDFPEEVGGGGFTGMDKISLVVRKKLYERLSEEVDRISDPMSDKAFDYIFSRSVVMDISRVSPRHIGLDPFTRGKPLLKGMLKWKVQRLADLA